jgi:uncharacterized protein YqeY
MKLSDQINADIMNAMREKDKIKLEALRAAKSAFILARTQEGAAAEISDADELKIIQKLIKQRVDSAAIYKDQSRTDLYEKEVAEAKVLEVYMPAQLSSEELKLAIRAIIEKTGAKGPQDMGKVMGFATKELAGKTDGKAISTMVKELLAQ